VKNEVESFSSLQITKLWNSLNHEGNQKSSERSLCIY